MKDLFRRYQGPALVFLLLAVPLYSLGSSKGSRQNLGPVDRSFIRLLGFAQSQSDGALGSISTFWDDYIDLVDVKAENEELRDENARLREENIRLQGILQENARLSRLVGFKAQRPALALAPARVIAADVSPYFRVLKIRLDVGEDVVAPGMPVVSAEGVVGQIESVSNGYAEVMLAIDPRSHIDVLTQSNRTRGLVSGLGHDRSYAAEISFLLRSDEVEEGDLVVTSGRGGRFPKELLVGRISTIKKEEYGLYQSASIEPAVDFSRLEEVYVVTNIEVAPPSERRPRRPR